MQKILVLVLVNLTIAFAVKPETLQKLLNPAGSRVVGGRKALDGERPFQIILRRNGQFSCGGSLIGTKTVLTAAHCVAGNENNPTAFTVQYNTLKQSSGGQTVRVTKVVRHAQYDAYTTDFDYAVLHLAEAFTPGTNAAIGELVADGHDSKSGDTVIVSGFGRVVGGGQVSEDLLVAELTVLDRDTCQSRVAAGRKVTPQSLCAYAVDKSACHGDSGGPLTCDGGKICGVVSWGSPYCLYQDHPNVYARVGIVRQWIDSNFNG